MKRIEPSKKAVRLSTSIPAELNGWMSELIESLAEKSEYGTKPSVSAIVVKALCDYKKKVEDEKNKAAMGVKNNMRKGGDKK